MDASDVAQVELLRKQLIATLVQHNKGFKTKHALLGVLTLVEDLFSVTVEVAVNNCVPAVPQQMLRFTADATLLKASLISWYYE